MDEAVGRCIEELLTRYATNPLLHLREAGFQHALASHLESRFPGTCAAEIGNSDPRVTPFDAPKDHRVSLVQLEAKIQSSVGDDDRTGSQRSDILLLRQDAKVRLTRFPNGALDVVARVPCANVIAAVEIKSACSADKGQRHLFRKDIAKLWSLAPGAAISRHFVLIDRSISFPGYITNLSHRDEWHVEDNADMKGWTLKARWECWETSPRITIDESVPSSEHFVHIWDLVADPVRTVRHRYATDVNVNVLPSSSQP